MYAVWNFPVDNFHVKMYDGLIDGKFILPDDYDDAVFKMVNGTRKARSYYAFFSKIVICITVMRVKLTSCLLQVTRRMPGTWRIPGVRWKG